MRAWPVAICLCKCTACSSLPDTPKWECSGFEACPEASAASAEPLFTDMEPSSLGSQCVILHSLYNGQIAKVSTSQYISAACWQLKPFGARNAFPSCTCSSEQLSLNNPLACQHTHTYWRLALLTPFYHLSLTARILLMFVSGLIACCYCVRAY